MLCECHLFSEREKIRRKREKKGRRQRGKEGVGGKKLFAQRFIARIHHGGSLKQAGTLPVFLSGPTFGAG
jgi:hypothetical protein